jgi:hypothetical protein
MGQSEHRETLINPFGVATYNRQDPDFTLIAPSTFAPIGPQSCPLFIPILLPFLHFPVEGVMFIRLWRTEADWLLASSFCLITFPS